MIFIVNFIEGIIQEEKEAEEYKDKILEMKKSKVNESLYLLSKTINFESSVKSPLIHC